MTKRFHIALEVRDIAASVQDYSERLNCKPVTVVEGKYALWRTDSLNFSIRQGSQPGRLRQLGFEDSDVSAFSKNTDINGLVWESFTADQQQEEIKQLY